jgi:hypothetical protein
MGLENNKISDYSRHQSAPAAWGNRGAVALYSRTTQLVGPLSTLDSMVACTVDETADSRL